MAIVRSAVLYVLRLLVGDDLNGCSLKVAERTRVANRLVRAKIENKEQAVAALVTSDDPP